MRQTRGKREYRRRDSGKPVGKAYSTVDEAAAALDSRMQRTEQGWRAHQWAYTDANGETMALVLRYNLPTPEGEKQQKTFRPISKHPDGWRLCDPPGAWRLYGLPELARTDRIYVVEGEKAADAARSIGLTATTSAHGADSADKTDWSPLAGKQVVILPDHDAAGEHYADEVTAILTRLTPAPTVRSVELPNLPDHGDIVDWIDGQGEAAEPEDLRRQVEALADAVETNRPPRSAVPAEGFQPVPTDALPEPVRGFVEAGAKSIGCDPSYVALPMLAALAAAIGNTRRIRLKQGWTAPAIIWVAIVGESGTSKTPAFKLVMRPIRERQQRALERHAAAMQQFEEELTCHDKKLAQWKRDKKTTELPPSKPEPPQAARCIVSDTTVEALAPLLLANPRGLLLSRDELAGWIGSFDRYAGGKGSADAAHWLSMHNGETIVVDRKTGNPRTVFVPQACVSICGGIQPSILHRALGREHRESGLAARLLLTCPPRKAKQWTEADIAPSAETEIAKLLERLYELQPTFDHDGNPSPVVVSLTPEAKLVWTAYYDSHAQEQVALSGELSAAWSKLEEYAARFALVIHCTRWAAGDPDLQSPDAVDAESMAAGGRLAQWFKQEARRVYAILSQSDDDRNQRKLIGWIGRKGGQVTAREVQQGNRQFKTASAAEAALEDLVKRGHGRWEAAPSGQRGQPTRRFVLSGVYGNGLNLDENAIP